MNRYLLFQFPGQTLGLHLKVIVGLKVHPKFRFYPEVASKTQRRNSTLAANKRVDPSRIDSYASAQKILAERPIGTIKSSFRISPGCTGAIFSSIIRLSSFLF